VNTYDIHPLSGRAHGTSRRKRARPTDRPIGALLGG
jgi:hypothetical protein